MAETIAIRLSRCRPWRWIRDFANELEARGHVVRVALVDGQPGLPVSLSLLFALESTLFGRDRSLQTDLLPPSEWPATGLADRPDVTIDLSGTPSSDPATGRTLVPVYDGGACSEDAVFAALLAGQAPRIGFRDVVSGQIVAEGLVAIDDFSVLSRSADQAFSRMRSIGLTAVSSGHVRQLDDHSPARAAGITPLRFAATQLMGKVTSRLTSLAGRPHHWRIGYRSAAFGDRIWHHQRLPEAAWSLVPDDGARYFADPFPFESQGKVHLFCEEYPYATARGIISVMEIGADGHVGPAVPIIETGYHLSYPFIFERDGTIWMVPETSENGTIELWRCTEYPRKWERHAVLVGGVSATDATILFGDDRLHMFASVKHAGSASHDGLMIWSSPTLEGPWTAFSTDPVLFDARASRPAGRMQIRGGVVWRPAQDCSTSYGSALTLCRVDTLDAETGAFHQRVMARIEPPTDRPWTGIHTLNEAGGLEFIDLCGRSRL